MSECFQALPRNSYSVLTILNHLSIRTLSIISGFRFIDQVMKTVEVLN